MTDFQEPMARVKGLGSAHKGISHWIGQRVSALILMPLSLWFLLEFLSHTQAEYRAGMAWVAQPWNSAALALFTGMVFYHSSLGLAVVIEDYIPHPVWKTYCLIKVKVTHLALAVLSWFFIIRIMIAGTPS